VADSNDMRFLSIFGGQVDFIRGASISDDGEGKLIIALPSTSKKGQSKIVPHINEGGTKLHMRMVLFNNEERICDKERNLSRLLVHHNANYLRRQHSKDQRLCHLRNVQEG
uniref:AcetylCoA_hyd_C domain-containing protein n=1 Tax=Haemonchus contortus TaxID=6289 RepID=A0A7I4Z076_HAECO